MGLTSFFQDKTITRCGVSEPASREIPIYEKWYTRFVWLFGLLCVVTIVLALLFSDLGTTDKIAITVVIGSMIVAYQFWGRWDLITSDFHVLAYLTYNVIAVTISIRIWDGSAILLFAAYWMTFAYLYTRPAIIFAVFLTLASQWAFGTFDEGIGWNQQTLIFLGTLAVIIGFSSMMAIYIEAFQREADKNRSLLEQLKAAQANLLEREREAGVEAERQRLAGEIHDTIAQHFASVITNLNAANELSETHPDTASQHISHAMSAAQQGMTDSRSLLSTMQPDVMQGRTLTDVLETFATSPHPSEKPVIRFVTEGQAGSIGRVRESLMVRALQEGLRNIRKHADASVVVVTLTWLEDEVLLDVSDDGCGFDPDQVNAGQDGYRIGLSTLRSRIEDAGGTVVLDSTPGEGTSVTIAFPTGDSQ